MKLSIRALRVFLVLATVETLSLILLATAARTEPLAPETVNNTDKLAETLKSEPTEVAPAELPAEFTPEPTEEAPAEPTEVTPAEPTEVAPTEPTPEPIEVAPTEPEPTEEAPTEPTSTDNSATIAIDPTKVRILTPTPDQILDIPVTTVVLQFAVGSEVDLRVNDIAVDPALIGRIETDAKTEIVTQTWYGVVLKQGDNTITAKVITNDVPGEPTSVKVKVRGEAKAITIKTLEARIPADGRSTATIQGQLVDDKGNVAKQDAVVTLAATDGEFIGADSEPDQEGFQVQATQGEFTAQLRSSLAAQTVRIRAVSSNLEAFTQLQFETNLRSSIVTGVIDLRLGSRGTDYYSRFKDFLPPDGDNSTQLDFHSAVFATGKIGDWLFTGAYNSDRTLNEDCNGNTRLFRDTDACQQEDRIYGDNSQIETLTPSQDSLYLRFERSSKIAGADPDYAMWGDYETEEFARDSQEFTSTTRELHGFKANYNLGNLQVTGFYGNNIEGFQRDAIAPDGTSGFYFLSRRLLIPGSETVFFELEELNRPGTVIERQQLNRGPDYEIDYDRGTLLFRDPVLRTDIGKNGETLVRRIIITYQFDSQGDTSNIYGARVQYHISRELNRESWIGATYIKENQGVRHFELYGADARIALGSNAELIAEYAHSSNDSDVMGRVSGSAYRLEVEGEIAKGIRGRAFYRSTESGFANDATVSFVPGQTRYGAEITGKVSPTTNVRLQYDHENNYGVAPQPLDTFEDLLSPGFQAIPGSRVDNSLTTIAAGIQQFIGKAEVNVDWLHRHREDRIATNPLSSTSDQLRSRLNFPLTDSLSLIAQNELTFSSDTDSVYPDRTLLGLNWEVSPGVNVRLAQQFFTGGQYNGNSITSLDVTGEHKFASNTTLTGRYSLLNGADGLTSRGSIGIEQGIILAPGLKLDLAYEHVFGDFFGRTAAGTQFPQPFAPGQSASSLGVDGGDSYSVGLSYTDNPDFQASARYEHRSSSGGSNTVISADAKGKITPSLTGLFRYQQANSSNQRLSGLGDSIDLKLGLAYRDIQSDKFNALLRYEYRKNPATTPDTILFGSGTGSEDHTFAVEAIYAPNWQWEFYGKYAFRHSTSYLANDLVGTSTINLAQLRATYRLGYKWDLVGEARWITQPSAGYTETGFVVEAGYYLTPNLRLAAGYAFGNVNDEDFSGSRSASGAYVGLTVKLNELFDGFGLQKVAPPQQQESTVEPIGTKLPTFSQVNALVNSEAMEFSQAAPANLQIELSHTQTADLIEKITSTEINNDLSGIDSTNGAEK